MKDYIVFFTEGFDKYNIDKQIRAYPRAFVSTIDSAPEYDVLKEEARKAKDDGYDNFYMFWEKNSVHSVTEDMKSEFYEFHDTGALPYKYNKKLIEGEAVLPQNTTPLVNNAGAITQANNIQVNSTGQDISNIANQVAVSQPNRNGLLSMNYSKNHAVSIFIWPCNAYVDYNLTKNSLDSMADAFKSDNLSRSPNKAQSTSTVYTTKKGPWDTIIYIPKSMKELNQNIANAGQMIEKMNAMLNNRDGFTNKSGFINGNPMIAVADKVFNKNESRRTGGGLDEASLLAAIRKFNATATKDNIAIFCSDVYLPYVKWCSHVASYGAKEPEKTLNNIWIKAFKRIDDYMEEALSRIESTDINSEYIQNIDFNNTTVIQAFNKLNKPSIDIFIEYYKFYKEQKNGDIYGDPNFKLVASKDSLGSLWGNYLDSIEELKAEIGGKHLKDLEKFRDALGLNNKASDILKSFKAYARIKDAVADGVSALKGTRLIAWNKIQEKFKKNEPLTPEEKAELEKVLAEYDNKSTQQENEQGNQSQKTNDQSVNQPNQNSANKTESDNTENPKDAKGQDNKKLDNKMEVKESIDLVDIFLTKFLEDNTNTATSQTATQATVTPANQSADATQKMPAKVPEVNNANNDQHNQQEYDNNTVLSNEDKYFLIILFALSSYSNCPGDISLNVMFNHFYGAKNDFNSVNEVLVALKEAMKPQIRQETLNKLNKNQQKQDAQVNAEKAPDTGNMAKANPKVNNEEKGKAKAEDLAEGPITETNPD